jgi:hypothetical protein
MIGALELLYGTTLREKGKRKVNDRALVIL